MTRYFPVVIERESNGTLSAWVAGLPGVYAAADTVAAVKRGIRSALAAHVDALESLDQDAKSDATVVVLRRDVRKARGASFRFVSVGALLARGTSPAKQAASRANGRRGGRPRGAPRPLPGEVRPRRGAHSPGQFFCGPGGAGADGRQGKMRRARNAAPGIRGDVTSSSSDARCTSAYAPASQAADVRPVRRAGRVERFTIDALVEMLARAGVRLDIETLPASA